MSGPPCKFQHGSVVMYPNMPGARYSFPDPTSERFCDAAHTARYGTLTRDQCFALAEAAEALAHLLTHPAGTESVIVQLRDVRRALKEKGRGDGG